MSLLGVVIAWPWLALIPAAGFFALARATTRGLVRIAAVAWLAYAAYEYAMWRRWLCSGDCNVRVDLLLIYPALLALSLAAVIAGLRSRRRRPSG